MRNLPPPSVSILIPLFNGDPSVVCASLKSICNQTYPDFECIVIDESTSIELAQEYRRICAEDKRFIYVHPDTRLGLADSLNLAISMARGELLARFDSDDQCLPERLENQVSFMNKNPEIGMVGSAIEIIDASGKRLAVRTYPEIHEEIVRKLQYTNSFAHPTVMYRAQVVKSHGAYNSNFRFAEDLELWLRWFGQGVQFANLPNVLVRYRQNQTSRGIDNWQYNIKARVINFDRKLFFLRIAGIAIVLIWSIIPSSLQESIYRLVIFNHKKANN